MIRVFVTLFNNGHLIPRCLESIAKQNEKFQCYIIDDKSTDNSIDQTSSLILGDNRFFLIANEKKLYQTGCYDFLIQNNFANDEDICVAVDSDDYLIGENVFELIKSEYNKGALITHGSYINKSGESNDSLSPPYDISRLRNYASVPSHLKTWKTFLWKKIPKKYLLNPQGSYWNTAGDLAFMYAMMEIAFDKIGFIDKPIYCYDDTQISCNHHKNPGMQKHNDYIIRNQTLLFKIF